MAFAELQALTTEGTLIDLAFGCPAERQAEGFQLQDHLARQKACPTIETKRGHTKKSSGRFPATSFGWLSWFSSQGVHRLSGA